MGAEHPPGRQVGRERGIPTRMIGCSPVHHSQPEPLDPGSAASALKSCLAQRIHWIGNHEELSVEPCLHCGSRIVRDQRSVFLKLDHAHIHILLRQIRHAHGCAKDKHIALKHLVRRNGPDLWKRVRIIRHGNLVQFLLPPADVPFIDIADPDFRNDIASHETQSQRQSSSHISHGENVDAAGPARPQTVSRDDKRIVFFYCFALKQFTQSSHVSL